MSQSVSNKRRKLSPAGDSTAPTTASFYQNASQWDLEEAYEQRSKRQQKKDKRSDKLPIKKGSVVEQVSREEDATAFLSDEEELKHQEVVAVTKAEEEEISPEPVHDTRSLKEQIREAKEDLARIAGLISEDPEEHIGQLKALAKISSSRHATIKRLALAAQLAIYRDIIPGYRIRPVSAEDAKAKLSKDVKRLRNFEQTLVSCYKDYLNTLTRTIKSGSEHGPGSSQASVASTAFTCTCTLLIAVPHFNFRTDLLNIMVNKLSSKQLDGESQKCVGALETLFVNDEDGVTSQEAVTLLTKMFKAKDYNIHAAVLNTFLQLRLLSEYSHRGSMNRIDKEDEQEEPSKFNMKKKHREFRTKRERKLLRERKAIQKEFTEADAIVGHEERDKHQSEILKMVFVAYFRILKQRKQNLMGTVLEGLARYAHLINQDFFGDILESLRDLVATLYQDDESGSNEAGSLDDSGSRASESIAPVRRDKSREMLLCTVTAFALLHGQDVVKSASSLHLDLSFFTKQLYNAVLPLSLDARAETTRTTHAVAATASAAVDAADESAAAKEKRKVDAQTPVLLLLRSLTSLLLPAQQVRLVPASLLAAFVKRLATASLHLPERSALAVLALVRQVVRVHGAKVTGLWYSEETRGDGVFDMERDEWGSANPFATNVWEGEVLRLHWSEKVRAATRDLEEAVVSRRG